MGGGLAATAALDAATSTRTISRAESRRALEADHEARRKGYASGAGTTARADASTQTTEDDDEATDNGDDATEEAEAEDAFALEAAESGDAAAKPTAAERRRALGLGPRARARAARRAKRKGGARGGAAGAAGASQAFDMRHPLGGTKKPKKIAKPLTAKYVLNCLYDILEKKLITDVTDERAGKPLMSFAEYTRYYFTQKYGLRAVAKRHLGEFLYTMESVRSEDRRVQLFHILLGLSARTYTQHINHAFFRALRRLLTAPDDVAELKRVRAVLDDGEGVLRARLGRRRGELLGGRTAAARRA